MAFECLFFLLKMSFFTKKIPKFSKISNHNSETSFCRYMYIQGFAKFLVYFMVLFLFFDIFTLVKIKLGQKQTNKNKNKTKTKQNKIFFLDFSKVQFLTKNLTI